tara:strand:+ start:76 stop:261 length:186 start_codon:yes stop_codon:yes gene_type:complete
MNQKNKIVITANNINPKQWSTLLLELNLMKSSWRPFGVKLDLQAQNFERIVNWGTKKHDEL